jgi:alpha-L-fucosidase 2
MEWLKPYQEFDPKHRHVSHLYAFYPSNQITRRGTPELTEAVRKVLKIRDDPAGWTGAWKINLHARIGDAEESYRVLHRMQTDISKHPQPEDSERVPSMEGNQGIQAFTAGIVEMLLQSHAGEIEFLPALPKAWATGSAKGLRARGGVTIDLVWREGKFASATLATKFAGPIRLRVPGNVELRHNGVPVATHSLGDGLVEFSSSAGATYAVIPRA